MTFPDYLPTLLRSLREFTREELMFELADMQRSGRFPEIPADYVKQTPELLRKLEREGCIEAVGDGWKWKKMPVVSGEQRGLFA